MPWQATKVILTGDDRRTLESWTRASSSEYRNVFRAKIILGAGDGETSGSIAKRLCVTVQTVSKWRKRFAQGGVPGLLDAPRSGKPVKYGDAMERRILKKLDDAPPSGYASWNGSLLAQHLGDVSADHVWRVLRKHRISLQRRHSWCISTDREFATKAADIVGLELGTSRKRNRFVRGREAEHSGSGTGPRLAETAQRKGTHRLFA